MPDREYLRHDFGPRGERFLSARPGTKGLILLLCVVHFLQLLLGRVSPAAGDWIYRWLALHPPAVFGRLRVWQVLTAAFLHATPFHLLVNCIMLWFFGKMVEDRLGLRRYLLFFVGASVAASIGYIGWALLSEGGGMVGASGAVMGMVALAALWEPQMTVLFFLFEVKLWVLAIVILGLDLLYAVAGPDGVAHTAHLGGAAYGWIYFRFGGRIDRFTELFDFSRPEKRLRRELARRDEEQRLRREVDAILDKVNREGMGALSDREKKFLKRASARLRRPAP
jgi:membrane associated rhomboid family serine protease